MITKKTTIILGAGASMPVGYPSGEGLVKKILELSEQNQPLWNFLHKTFPRGDSSINRFREDLKCASQPSIDKFLESRTEYADMGKSAIAFVLSQCESEAALHDRSDENWYRRLFAELSTHGKEGLARNEARVITFNYDRSLEQFLFIAIKGSYGVSSEEAARLVMNVQILHVHGSLGALPWQVADSMKEPSSEYGPKAEDDWSEIWDASDGIHIVGENATSDRYRTAREWLVESERVHFLGFGFEKSNFDRLGVPLASDPHSKYYGTSFGLGSVRTKQVGDLTGGRLKLYPRKIHEYLHEEQAF